MLKKPSSRPARAQEIYRPSEKLRRAIAESARPTKSVCGRKLAIYSFTELKKAFKDASLTPQARTKSPITPSHRVRDLTEFASNHPRIIENNLKPLFLKQCEQDILILKVLAQPFIVDFEGYLGLGSYIPSFVCYPYRSKPWVVDVSEKTALTTRTCAPFFEARKQAFKDVGYELKAFTEDNFSAQTSRCKVIQIYTHFKSPPKVLRKTA
ncbi:hypothetical protein [Zhongshania sp.]|jgi:hypothetical protein|uniref:hypothetical protein n=1 Tax=Zhongshania sp. TaxID=1971902 RepID=UPI0039E3C04F